MKLHRFAGAGRGAFALGRAAERLRAVMRMGLVGTVLAGAVIAGLPTGADAAGRVMVVRNDRGGDVKTRIAEIERLRREGARIELRGKFCASSCTMYLGLPNACVDRNTTFAFHGPSSGLYGIALPDDQFEHWSRVMASYYPQPLRNWFLREGRMVTVGFHKKSGAELIRMGVPECRRG